MGDTYIWHDMVSNITIDRRRSVYLKRTWYEKSMVRFCVVAKADGTKLKPFFVFRQKTRMYSLDEEFESRCVIKNSANAFRLL